MAILDITLDNLEGEEVEYTVHYSISRADPEVGIMSDEVEIEQILVGEHEVTVDPKVEEKMIQEIWDSIQEDRYYEDYQGWGA